jgi:hypothetical protein
MKMPRKINREGTKDTKNKFYSETFVRFVSVVMITSLYASAFSSSM